jgi:IPT/TIG domain
MKPIPDDVLHQKIVTFPRPHGPHDYFRMGRKAIRYLMLGSIIVGHLTLGLWYKQERLVGAQRQYTYVEKIEKGKKYFEILAVNVYFTAGGSYGRDQYMPGWPGTSNTVDCIGGGGGGNNGGPAGSAGGGGGGGLARYNNVGNLPATFGCSVGAGGTPNVAGGNTQLDGWVGAYGGGTGTYVGAPGYVGLGGAGGTYYAGQGYFAGGAGGNGEGYELASGGGGGAAGRYGGGGAGGHAAYQMGHGGGGTGGPSGGGAGTAQGTGGPVNGNNGNEWATNVGSGGGGNGAYPYTSAQGGHGGYYGGGGGGGCSKNYSGAGAAGHGRSGLIAIVYTPYPTPTVSSCTPASGSMNGGTSITIGGANFYNVTGVTVGGTAATSVVVNSSASVTCVTPAHAAGLVAVIVGVGQGVIDGPGANVFTYANPPVASSNAPALGLVFGGTAITITGTFLSSVTSVTVGGVAATSVVAAAGSITCVTPAHAAGLVNIVVSGGYGSSTLTNAFTYMLPASGFNMPMV